MQTETFVVPKFYTDEFMEKHEGKFFSSKGIKIFKDNVDIFDEQGKPICKFRKNVLTQEECQCLFQLNGAAKLGKTRPSASGIPPEGKYKYIISKSTGKKLHVLTTQSRSGIVGFWDTLSNFGHKHDKHAKDSKKPKCRTTAYTGTHLEQYKDCLPVFQKINKIFKELVPKQYSKQKKAIGLIDSQFIIPKTIFTTVTVNKNFRTALHKDSGDCKEGFGNLVVASCGNYTGGYTLFPQYKFGIDCRNGDFLAMDVHTWHCNSEFNGDGTRISFVFYLREKMQKTCPKQVNVLDQ
jgi:hypothetical protein